MADPPRTPRSAGHERFAQWLAFGLAAGVYDLITNQEPWRRDCREMARLVPGGRVLDLGVGPGTSALEMAGASPSARFVGLDLSWRMLERAQAHAAQKRVALPLGHGDALRLPFRDESFDGATGHSVLYLLPDARAVLAEVYRVVRPGGRIAFLEPREGKARILPTFRDGLRAGTAMGLWRVM